MGATRRSRLGRAKEIITVSGVRGVTIQELAAGLGVSVKQARRYIAKLRRFEPDWLFCEYEQTITVGHPQVLFFDARNRERC